MFKHICLNNNKLCRKSLQNFSLNVRVLLVGPTSGPTGHAFRRGCEHVDARRFWLEMVMRLGGWARKQAAGRSQRFPHGARDPPPATVGNQTGPGQRKRCYALPQATRHMAKNGLSSYGSRSNQSGMRWTVRGANPIVALRCFVLSGEYEDFRALQAKNSEASRSRHTPRRWPWLIRCIRMR